MFTAHVLQTLELVFAGWSMFWNSLLRRDGYAGKFIAVFLCSEEILMGYFVLRWRWRGSRVGVEREGGVWVEWGWGGGVE